MKIRWRLRFKNPTTILSMLGVLLTLTYTVLDSLGIMPTVADGTVNAAFVAIMQILALIGVTVDPTTKGLSDSARALTYTKPADTKEAQPTQTQTPETQTAESQASEVQMAEAQTVKSQMDTTETVPPAFEFGTAGSQIRFYHADEETASSASQNTEFKPE